MVLRSASSSVRYAPMTKPATLSTRAYGEPRPASSAHGGEPPSAEDELLRMLLPDDEA